MNIVSVESQKLAIMPTEKIMEYYINSLSAPSTMKTYNSTLKTFFMWVKKDFKSITPYDAIEFNQYQKDNFAESTVQNRIATLNEFFKFCKEVGLIDKNPFAVVKQSAPPNRAAEKFMVPRESSRLLKALRKKSEQRYIFGLLLSALGTRVSEIQQLSVCDILETSDGSVLIGILGKGNKKRLLPLRQDVWEQVKAFINRPLSQFDKTALLVNPSGNRISTVSLRSWIAEARKEAKIEKKITPHWLRHTFATNSLDNGADIRDLSWFLGHASLSSTQIYAHPTNKRVGEFVEIDVQK